MKKPYTAIQLSNQLAASELTIQRAIVKKHQKSMVELIKNEQDYNLALNGMELLVEDGIPDMGTIEHDALVHIINIIHIYEDSLNPMLNGGC